MPPRKSPHLRKMLAAGDRAIRSVERTRGPGPDSQYRLLFQSNPNPMWIFDEATLRFLEVNEAAVKLYGWSREEFLRMTVKEVRPLGERPKLAKKLALQRGSRLAFVGEWRHWKKDHTPLDVEVTISCVQFQGHDARLTMVNDITERKRAEAALRESEARYRSLFQYDLTGDFVADPNGKILFCNPAFAAIFGFSTPEAASGTNLASLWPDPKSWSAFVKRLRRRKPLIRQESAARRRDGTPLHVVQTVIGSFSSRGELLQMQGYVFDDTGRRKAEAQLKELNVTLEQRVAQRTAELSDAHDRFRAITDSALVGILTLNERGMIESLNPAAVNLFGRAPEAMLGRNVGEFMASPHAAKKEDFLTHYTQTGDQRFMAIGREVLGWRKDGHAMPLELTVSDFKHGGRREFVAMVRNITERKRLERELLEIGERERQRLGHDLHDGLGQHLHALYYMASLLEKEIKEAEPERGRKVGRLAAQLEHALELSRSLAHGLQPVNAVPEGLMMALRELAERARDLYRVDCRFACRKPVLLHRHTAANHLYRIAQEAVNNAMKHAKPTRIRIKLTESRQRIVLGIRDNGVGIRTQAGHARGMGLHIMQYRAGAIHGSLLVQRHFEGGTEVVCTVSRDGFLPQEEGIK